MVRCRSTTPLIRVRVRPGSRVCIVTKRLRVEGFLVSDFFAAWPAAEERLAGWIESGELTVLEDVMDGLESAPHALVGLLAGDNIGKRIVRVAPDP